MRWLVTLAEAAALAAFFFAISWPFLFLAP